VAIHSTGKNRSKEHRSPNYNFLVSWTPSEARVNRESNYEARKAGNTLTTAKKAEIQAKEDSVRRIKKDIIKSMVIIGIMLIGEVVVYLARSRITLP
jgi:hypothetical protein